MFAVQTAEHQDSKEAKHATPANLQLYRRPKLQMLHLRLQSMCGDT